jgi:cytochrome d ubiquinol oxidase subunit I
MIENVDLTLIDWSRAQFALTAMVHWIFVPLTLGLSFMLAFMETLYYKTGDPEWKKLTKFWMKLFGINFAIGVATGIILEFEFGTNWSNYSWFVGDIFGAPLAIEGIMAFFLESTFVAVMFFGWGKVSKGFHLTATWLTAIGANLSALWILVANAWMQNPRGMQFNPETARNEMINFWDVLLSPTAVNKFIHTTTSGFVLAAIFVIGISAWFLLKNREHLLARRSIIIASVFGLISSLVLIGSGDSSGSDIARNQPMKLAAMEGLYVGQEGTPLVAMGIMGSQDEPLTRDSEGNFIAKIEIPYMLSLMAFKDPNAYVAGIQDIIHGNEQQGILSTLEKIKRGYGAQQALAQLKAAKKSDPQQYDSLKTLFTNEAWLQSNFRYFGYGIYYDEDPVKLEANAYKTVPPVSLTFYAFRVMVILGTYFLLLFAVMLFLAYKDELDKRKWILWAAVWTIPLAYIASEAGWVVAEVGRQPWVVQDLMTTMSGVSRIDSSSVIITFWLFAITFAALLTAEIRIMLKQIKVGPKEGGHK